MWSSLKRNLLQINTMPTIQGCLKKYFSGIKPTEVQELTLTDRLTNRAIQSQEMIGIRRARVRHLSSLWAMVQEDYINQSPPNGPGNGLQWAILATKKVWSSRNTDLHSSTTISLANTAATIKEIQ